ncbi:MAG TPA: ABC transporter substrate-binding protein [Paraburkholderia sp.]|nr:ABC transporter substrate-binding protein [Paraburkholderia sp.]
MTKPLDIDSPDLERRRAVKTLLAAGAATAASWSALAGAATATAAAGKPRRGGVMRVATANQSLSDSLDPAKASHTADYSRMFIFYSGLTEFDSDFKVKNALADAFDTSDHKQWTVKLKPNVHFHDGKPLTADDVVFSLSRHKQPATASKAKSIADAIESVRAAGPLQVDIVLSAPNVDLPALLAVPHFVIVADGTKDFSKGNGTGPFVCKEFTPGGRCVGTRNPNFWKPGLPYLDEVQLVGILDDAARLNALLAGDVQLVSPVPARDVERLKRAGGFGVLESQSGLYTDLILRQDAMPTGNPGFVQAMKYLHDRERIQKTLLRGYATIGNDHPVPAWHPYYLAGLPQRTYDPDRAKSLIKQANLSGAAAEIVVPPSIESALDSALMVQQAALQTDLKIGVRRVPADGYWSTHWMKHPMTYGSILPRPTLDLLYTQFFKSDSVWNESGWKSAQFDQLLLQAREEKNETKRKQIYGDMQTIVYEKGSIIIPAFINFIDAHSNRVKGLAGTPSGRLMGYRFAEFAWLDAA